MATASLILVQIKKGFLEFSNKNKMYDMNYTESLYMEIYLMLHTAELLIQELNKN